MLGVNPLDGLHSAVFSCLMIVMFDLAIDPMINDNDCACARINDSYCFGTYAPVWIWTLHPNGSVQSLDSITYHDMFTYYHVIMFQLSCEGQFPIQDHVIMFLLSRSG